MPLVTALSMYATADLTRLAASPDLSSTATRAFLTAVRSDAIAARLRARCLIILRFCFCADAILATACSLRREWVTRALPGVKRAEAGSQSTRISVEKREVPGSIHRCVWITCGA